jgi:hypothetical protein
VLEFLLLRQQFTLSTTLINLAMLLADVATLGWVGMWLGLTARNLNRAILDTIARVLILPWGAWFAGLFALDVLWRLSGRGSFEPSDRFGEYFWFGIGLANNFLFGFCWARRHLLNDFRRAATQRYQPAKFGWLIRLFRRKDVAPLRAPVTVQET